MPVKGTANYVWFPDQRLGGGATGDVFIGRHKTRGTACGIKVFKSNVNSQQIESKRRELELTKRLNHDNVVKFIAIEDETRTKDKVLVMELCSEGSVHDLLNKPIYKYGFPEDLFLIFLQDLGAGMKYLFSQDIIHRDIKPGNILCNKLPNGRFIFKLTDFGSARELAAGEQSYMSLCGTEEYLHPDIYGTALLNEHHDRFTATADLWSAGATLYHVATGSIPFIAFKGRSDRQTIYKIITQKEPSAISGVQRVENGPIVYSKDLPTICLYSEGLRKYLVPLIAGLLQREAVKQTNFEQFFAGIDDICTRYVVFVYCVASITLHRCYMNKDAKPSDIIQAISIKPKPIAQGGTNAPEVKLKREDERLFYKGIDLAMTFTEGYPIERRKEFVKYLKTSVDEPLIFWSRPDAIRHFVQFPDKPVFIRDGDLECDGKWAFDCSAFTCYVATAQKEIYRANVYIPLVKQILSIELRDKLELLRSRFANIRLLLNAGKSLAAIFNRISTGSGGRFWWSSAAKKIKVEGESLSSRIERLDRFEKHIEAMFQSFPVKPVDSVVAVKPVDSVVAVKPVDSIVETECEQEKCAEVIEACRLQTVAIYSKFLNDITGTLSHNELQIHKYERMKLEEAMNQTIRIFNGHCLKCTERVFQGLLDWNLSVYQKQKSDLIHWERDLEKFKDDIEEMNKVLEKESHELSRARRTHEQNIKGADTEEDTTTAAASLAMMTIGKSTDLTYRDQAKLNAVAQILKHNVAMLEDMEKCFGDA